MQYLSRKKAFKIITIFTVVIIPVDAAMAVIVKLWNVDHSEYARHKRSPKRLCLFIYIQMKIAVTWLLPSDIYVKLICN